MANTDEWTGRVSAAGGGVTPYQVSVVSSFIASLTALGLTNANSRVSGFVGNNLAAAMVPIFKGPGPDSDTNVGFVAGDFTPTKGILGTPGTFNGVYILSGCYADSFLPPDRMLSAWVVEKHGITYCGLLGCDGDGTGNGICNHGWWLNGIGSYPDPYVSISYNQSPGCEGMVVESFENDIFWSGGISPGASPYTALWRNGVKSSDYTYNDTTAVHAEIGILCFNRWSSTGNAYVTTSDLVRGYGFGVNPTSHEDYYTAWAKLKAGLSMTTNPMRTQMIWM